MIPSLIPKAAAGQALSPYCQPYPQLLTLSYIEILEQSSFSHLETSFLSLASLLSIQLLSSNSLAGRIQPCRNCSLLIISLLRVPPLWVPYAF